MDEIPDIPVAINNELERRIADVFEAFDHSGNKTIDIREVGTVVRALGCCPSEAEIQEILLAIEDPTMPGCIHLSKFLPHVAQMITEHRYEPASPAKLLEAFQVLDPENKGSITRDYISILMTQDGEPFSQEELDEMLEIAIDPQTNTVPYEYYLNKLMVSRLLYLYSLQVTIVYSTLSNRKTVYTI
ncbi:hypothetical protein PPYR_14020 [Photinus pyralis]|uniref:EF-hand domain-containing protein n=1 Tax=Photinus pyralis TaxID=7054 RepID=A0A5N4A462_PHOPY|nr:hypothetical protein PPYR_14020 [Photinus pyralis]